MDTQFQPTQGSGRSGLRGAVWAALAAAVGLGLTTPAAAGLINSTYDLRLSGPVEAGGQMSTEQYEGTGITFNGVSEDLTNTISPTPVPPFQSSANHMPQVAEPVGGVGTTGSGTIWIRGPGSDTTQVFLNPLKPDDVVELELTLNWEDLLGPLEKIVISNVEGENNGNFYDPVSVQTLSGIGSEADPLRLLIELPTNEIIAGAADHVKVRYDFATMVIPEPATLALTGLGLVAIVGLFRRRRGS